MMKDLLNRRRLTGWRGKNESREMSRYIGKLPSLEGAHVSSMVLLRSPNEVSGHVTAVHFIWLSSYWYKQYWYQREISMWESSPEPFRAFQCPSSDGPPHCWTLFAWHASTNTNWTSPLVIIFIWLIRVFGNSILSAHSQSNVCCSLRASYDCYPT